MFILMKNNVQFHQYIYIVFIFWNTINYAVKEFDSTFNTYTYRLKLWQIKTSSCLLLFHIRCRWARIMFITDKSQCGHTQNTVYLLVSKPPTYSQDHITHNLYCRWTHGLGQFEQNFVCHSLLKLFRIHVILFLKILYKNEANVKCDEKYYLHWGMNVCQLLFILV